jgi:DNA-binding PadR family transcriptional regulator
MGEYKPGKKAELILQLLREHPQGMYGLDLVRASNGQIGRGTVYVHLGRLEEEGLVESKRVRDPNSGLERPLYKLSRRGLRIPVGDPPGELSPVGA